MSYVAECPHCGKSFQVAMPKKENHKPKTKKITIKGKTFVIIILVIGFLLWYFNKKSQKSNNYKYPYNTENVFHRG